MYDIKFEESGLLAEFFGYGKVQLESSTKYIRKYIMTGSTYFYCWQIVVVLLFVYVTLFCWQIFPCTNVMK